MRQNAQKGPRKRRKTLWLSWDGREGKPDGRDIYLKFLPHTECLFHSPKFWVTFTFLRSWGFFRTNVQHWSKGDFCPETSPLRSQARMLCVPGYHTYVAFFSESPAPTLASLQKYQQNPTRIAQKCDAAHRIIVFQAQLRSKARIAVQPP